MNMKNSLKELQHLIPSNFLHFVQYVHCSLIWRSLINWVSKPLEFNHKSVMVFSPHQDDETFGCGGMISQKCEQGIQVSVVFLTNGSGGNSSAEYLRDQIIKIRQEESLTALNILGVTRENIHFLDQEDGNLQKLNHQQRKDLVLQIVKLINQYQPGEIYVPHHQDCHQDHEATYDLVKEAIREAKIIVRFLEYPIWLFWRSPLFILLKPQDLVKSYRYSIASVQEKKSQAIAAYSSQINSLPPRFINRFFHSQEIFFPAEYK